MRGRAIARKDGMQSLGTDGETQTHALLKLKLCRYPLPTLLGFDLEQVSRSAKQAESA
jgi:hypothetical protein